MPFNRHYILDCTCPQDFLGKRQVRVQAGKGEHREASKADGDGGRGGEGAVQGLSRGKDVKD